ncbi:MAG: ESX-1 secretion-associated protein [Mycobacteriaceae bacterium]|nr:ESX-1 secretion-associated protein [Mycobacteriaceae bacterium]
MADQINIVPTDLRQAAEQHQQVAECLRSVPSSHPAIQESLDSLGPIFHELREAGRELLALRSQCYEQQADDHVAMADNLRVSAGMWEHHEEDAARRLGSIVDGGQ